MPAQIAPGLGEAQRMILEEIKRRGPVTPSDLESRMGRARETLRAHLNTLVGLRLVERSGSRRHGPGRPEIVYRLTGDGEALFSKREGSLLAELIEFLISRDEEALLESFFSWRMKGRATKARDRLEPKEGLERMREVANLFSEEGFMADLNTEDPDGAPRLRLCHCPLKELVAVSDLPCRYEIALLEELLGRRLSRESYMPDGDPSCRYVVGEPI